MIDVHCHLFKFAVIPRLKAEESAFSRIKSRFLAMLGMTVPGIVILAIRY
jgi:hypothetical protein